MEYALNKQGIPPTPVGKWNTAYLVFTLSDPCVMYVLLLVLVRININIKNSICLQIEDDFTYKSLICLHLYNIYRI